MVEYHPSPWIDLTGEVTVGMTMQIDDLRTNELTFRPGLRPYLIKSIHERFDMGATYQGPELCVTFAL